MLPFQKTSKPLLPKVLPRSALPRIPKVDSVLQCLQKVPLRYFLQGSLKLYFPGESSPKPFDAKPLILKPA